MGNCFLYCSLSGSVILYVSKVNFDAKLLPILYFVSNVIVSVSEGSGF